MTKKIINSMLKRLLMGGLGLFATAVAATNLNLHIIDYPSELMELNDKVVYVGTAYTAYDFDYSGPVFHSLGSFSRPVNGTQPMSDTHQHFPSLVYAMPLNDQWHVSIGAAALRDLSDDVQFSRQSTYRYNYTRAAYETYDITAATAYRFNRFLTAAIAIDAMHSQIYFDADAPTEPTFNPLFDARSQNQANAWGLGWHAGLTLSIPQTYSRISLSYRSQVHLNNKGDSRLTLPLGRGTIVNNNFAIPLTLPDVFRVKLNQALSEQWALSLSYAYTRWSVIDVLDFQNIAGLQTVSSPKFFLWKDTSAYTLAVVHFYQSKWTLVPSLSWFESQERNASGYAIGSLDVFYKWSEALRLHVFYDHSFAYSYTPIAIGATSQILGTARRQQSTVGLSLEYHLL